MTGQQISEGVSERPVAPDGVLQAQVGGWEPPAWPREEAAPWKDKFKRRNLAWLARVQSARA